MSEINETLRRAFEAAWKEEQTPDLTAHLPDDSSAHFVATAEELVLIDMEFRWKRPVEEMERLAVEDYLRMIPALNGSEIIRNLIEQEWLCRTAAGESPDWQEYHTRFPEVVRTSEDMPAIEGAQGGTAAEGPGTVIAGYKLLQVIGEGGFGTVYMAEQSAPVRRRVALKIIKPGMDSREVIARFEAERQALALMEHESIARVFDAGQTASGRPFFVMELVHGIPITDFCDRNRLDTTARLQLFVEVCRAVQHAHQKGIIHRDLKPSNVLVTMHDDRPLPKVIDFGIVKATQQQLTEKTLFTQFGQVVGTPQYMSPEQAQMSHLDVDTRSDVYSLGVLLYELLTGTTPLERHQLQDAAFDEMLRLIREEEPPRPSSRISQTGEALQDISANRQSVPSRLGTLVRGELDWIVMKALEKDRSRRYEGPNALAEDILRHLENEPVLAGPPSSAYRIRKFVSKRKTFVLTATAFVIVFASATVFSAWQAYKANKESREKAEALVQRSTALQNEQAASALAQERLRESQAAEAKAARQARLSESHRLPALAEKAGDASPQAQLLLAARAVDVTEAAGDRPNPVAVEMLYGSLAKHGGQPLNPGWQPGNQSGAFSTSTRIVGNGRWLMGIGGQGGIYLVDLTADRPANQGFLIRRPQDKPQQNSQTWNGSGWQTVNERWLIVEEQQEQRQLRVVDLHQHDPAKSAYVVVGHELFRDPVLIAIGEDTDASAGTDAVLTVTGAPRMSPADDVDVLLADDVDPDGTVCVHRHVLGTDSTRQILECDGISESWLSRDRQWLYLQDRVRGKGFVCRLTAEDPSVTELPFEKERWNVRFSHDSRWLVTEKSSHQLLLRSLRNPDDSFSLDAGVEQPPIGPVRRFWSESANGRWLIYSNLPKSSPHVRSGLPITQDRPLDADGAARPRPLVRIWDLQSEDPTRSPLELWCDEMEGPSPQIQSDAISQSLVIDDGKGNSRLFDLNRLSSNAEGVSFRRSGASPAGTLVEFAGHDRFMIARTDEDQFTAFDLTADAGELSGMTIKSPLSSGTSGLQLNLNGFPLLSPDDRFLVVYTGRNLMNEHEFEIRDLNQDAEKVATVRLKSGLFDESKPVDIRFSPAGRWFCASQNKSESIGGYSSAVLWSTEDWRGLELQFRTGTGRLQFSPAEQWLVESGDRLGIPRKSNGSSGRTHVLPDGVQFEGYGKVIRLWDLGGSSIYADHRAVQRDVAVPFDPDALVYPFELSGHDLAIRTVHFSPDETLVVTTDEELNRRLWNLPQDASGHPTRLACRHSWPTDRGLVAESSVGDRQMLRLLANSGETLGMVESSESLNIKQVSDQARWLLVDHNDEQEGFLLSAVHVDWENGELTEHQLPGHLGVIQLERFSPDERWLVTAEDNAEARVWDLSGLNPTAAILLKTNGPIGQIEFSDDSRQLVILDSTALRAWDLRSEEPEPVWSLELLNHLTAGPKSHFQVSPDGRWLALTDGLIVLAGELSSDGRSVQWFQIPHESAQEELQVLHSTMAPPTETHKPVPSTRDQTFLHFDSEDVLSVIHSEGPYSRWNLNDRHRIRTANQAGRSDLLCRFHVIRNLLERHETQRKKDSTYVHIARRGDQRTTTVPCEAAVLSEDDRWVIEKQHDDVTRLWNTDSIERHAPAAIVSGAFGARDKNQLVTVTNQYVFVWNLAQTDPAEDPVRIPHGGVHPGRLNVALVDDHLLVCESTGGLSVSASSAADISGRVLSYQLKDPGTPIQSMPLLGDERVVYVSPDGRCIVVSPKDESARHRVVDFNSNPFVSTPLEQVPDIGFYQGVDTRTGLPIAEWSFDPKLSLLAFDSKQPVLWNLRRPQTGSSSRFADLPPETTTKLEVGGKWCLARSLDQTDLSAVQSVALYRLSDARILQPTQRWTTNQALYPKELREWDMSTSRNSVGAATLSRNGDWAVVSTSGRTLELWRLGETAESVMTVTDDESIRNLRFSPTGHLLAVYGSRSGIRVWDLAGDLPIEVAADPKPFGDAPSRFVFSNDGSHLICAAGNSQRTATWLKITTTDADAQVANTDTTAVKPSSIHLFSPRYSDTIEDVGITRTEHRWADFMRQRPYKSVSQDQITDELFAPVPLQSESDQLEPMLLKTTSAILSEDGRYLVTGSGSGEVRIWDLTGPDIERTAVHLPIPDNDQYELSRDKTALNVQQLRFSEDQQYLYVRREAPMSPVVESAEDMNRRTTEVWDLNLMRLVEQARHIAGREFSAQERSRYALDIVSESTN